MKIIAKWLKSTAGKISGYLLLVFGIFVFISRFVKSDLNSILIGIATNLVGIIVTVSFVQYFLDKQNVLNEKNEERNTILRYNRIMEYLIKRFICYFDILLTTLDKRHELDLSCFKENYKFSDMKNLYVGSYLVGDGLFQPAVESFYTAEKKLIDFCNTIICNINFKYYSEISELLLKLVEYSNSFDCRNYILGNQKAGMDETTVAQYASSLIADETQDWEKRFDNGDLNGNLIAPYVLLFKLLSIEKEYISKYTEIIKTIKNEDFS